MKSRSASLSVIPTIALLLLNFPTAASGIDARGNTDPGYGSRLASFADTTWLRNSVSRFIYGKVSSSTDDSRNAPWYQVARLPRYAKQTVIRFNLTTADEEAALAEMTERLFLDIWSFNNHTGMVDIRLDKEMVEPLLSLLPESLHRSYSHIIPDLAAAVRDTYPKLNAAGSMTQPSLSTKATTPESSKLAVLDGGGTDNVFFRDYQPYPVIVQWMKLLDVMFPFANIINVGETAEGREIYGLRVSAAKQARSSNADEDDDYEESDDEDSEEKLEGVRKDKKHRRHRKHNKDKKKDKKHKNHQKHNRKSKPTSPEPEPEPVKKKTILITGGLHAREWISSSSVNYVAWSMISGYGKIRMITKLVDSFDIIFVPVANPDGYEYTWQTDRLWRKTRQSTNFRYCRGFDLDHAFGFEWNTQIDDRPCSETYGGESAFQAIEARTLSEWARNEVAQNQVEFIGFLDLHSYSQQIMFPFAYSCAADPPNLENLEELAAGLAKAIRLSTGEAYSVSSACEGVMGYARRSAKASRSRSRSRIEPGGGSAIDWFYHELKAKYSYQIKLRDTGSYGFLLPSSEIVPTGEEVFSAVKYFGDFLLGNNGIEKSLESNGEDGAESDATAIPLADREEDDDKDGGPSMELRRRSWRA